MDHLILVNHLNQVHLQEVNSQAMVRDQEINSLVPREEALQDLLLNLVNLLHDLIQVQLKLLLLLTHNKPNNQHFLLQHRRKRLSSSLLNHLHNPLLNHQLNLPHNLQLSLPRNHQLNLLRNLPHNRLPNRKLNPYQPNLHSSLSNPQLVVNHHHNQAVLSHKNLVATLVQKKDSFLIQITVESSIDA